VNKKENRVKLYTEGDAQLSLFEIADTVKKTRSIIVDDIMTREVSGTGETFLSSEYHDDLPIQIKARIMLSYEGVDIKSKTELTPFDHEVVDAVATLALEGNEIVNTAAIYRVIAGRPKNQYVSPTQRERVMKSMEKCAFSKLSITIGNYDEIAGQLRLPGEATFSGNLLSFEMIKQKTNRGMTDYFRILAIPALFRYAASVGKISAFPIEMLDTPVSKTEGIILMQSFLLRRIDAMNRKEISDCTIFWKDIFAVGRDEGASRQQLQKTRGFICKILDYWKEKGFLKDYRADNRSRGKIKITPNYDFGRVQEHGKELPSG